MDVATLEPNDGATGGQLFEDRLDGLPVLGVDDLDERYSQQLLMGVPEKPWERRIGALQVPVEPRDAERFLRKLEQPYQLVVERLASFSHNNPTMTLLLVRQQAG